MTILDRVVEYGALFTTAHRATDGIHDILHDTDLGLSSEIVMKGRARIDHLPASVHAGMAQVNLPTACMDFHSPSRAASIRPLALSNRGSAYRKFVTVTKVVHAAFHG